MPKEKLKTIYVCNQCGETSPRWMGRCPSCGAWNTMTEDVVAAPSKSSSRAAAPARVTGQTSLTPQKLKNISTTEEKSRIITGISELDRVLGGGIVIGSVTLIGGEPGIGKSTILLQLCGEVSKTKNVLYVTGEESVRQGLVALKIQHRIDDMLHNFRACDGTVFIDVADDKGRDLERFGYI